MTVLATRGKDRQTTKPLTIAAWLIYSITQLLQRMASARFGAATADRLARALATEADPERLAVVGEAIVRCATGDELLRAAGVSK